jgi:hypothetical protein
LTDRDLYLFGSAIVFLSYDLHIWEFTIQKQVLQEIFF